MMNIKNYMLARSVEEAYQLNQKRGSRIIGGMMWLKMSNINVSTAIDISGLGLDIIEESKEEFSIGAMVTLRQIELHRGLNEYSQNMISAAVKDIVGVQFRNTATVGGSIFGRYGFSDVLTAFMAMDTYVELYKGGVISLEDFVQREKDRDLLLKVTVKKRPGAFVYDAMRNSRTDFPVLNCAVSRLEDKYRTVIGARPARAVVLKDEKGFLNEGLTENAVADFSQWVRDSIVTGTNMRGSADYRRHLAEVLTSRGLDRLGGK